MEDKNKPTNQKNDVIDFYLTPVTCFECAGHKLSIVGALPDSLLIKCELCGQPQYVPLQSNNQTKVQPKPTKPKPMEYVG